MLIIISLLSLISCGTTNQEMGIAKLEGDHYEDLMDIPVTRQSSQLAAPSESIQKPVITKKVVKTGGIQFQSEDIQSDYQKILKLLPKFNAYVENENQSIPTCFVPFTNGMSKPFRFPTT